MCLLRIKSYLKTGILSFWINFFLPIRPHIWFISCSSIKSRSAIIGKFKCAILELKIFFCKEKFKWCRQGCWKCIKDSLKFKPCGLLFSLSKNIYDFLGHLPLSVYYCLQNKNSNKNKQFLRKYNHTRASLKESKGYPPPTLGWEISKPELKNAAIVSGSHYDF